MRVDNLTSSSPGAPDGTSSVRDSRAPFRFFRRLAFTAIVGIVGCSGAVPAPPVAEVALPDRETFVRTALTAPVGTRAELREQLGTADSILHHVVLNRHVPGVSDTLFTVHYPALIVGLHRPGPGGELLSAVTVSSDDYLRWPVIGVERSRIEAEFGLPDRRQVDRIVYDCRTCVAGNDPVEFLFTDARVVAVRFNFYVD